MLRAGGTAADAAVAACALLGVIEPQSTGIGGDCFALIQPKGEGKIVAYNGSGRAPMAAKADWYLERKIHSVPLTSAHAVSIPGAVDAWETILRDHGKFGLDTLLQPAIKAAEEGYVVAPRIAFDWKNQFEKLKNGTNTERYLLPHGKPRGGRRRDPPARARQDPARHRARAAATPSTRAPSPKTWSRPCAASAACTRWRISPRTRTETTVADRHDVQGPRRLAVPAERARASPCW